MTSFHSFFGRIAAVLLCLALAVGLPTITQAATTKTLPNRQPFIKIRRQSTRADVGYTPAQIRHAYGFDQVNANGAGQIIGVVDAYDAPTIANDLAVFISSYNLPTLYGLPGLPTCTVTTGPHPCFQKSYTASQTPPQNGGWAQETALDVEWTHAIAPQADILLVEANNSSSANLFQAVDTAVKKGSNIVSMSWGGVESSQQTNYDPIFKQPKVAFVASSGDDGNGVSYPASSPYVISVGGTTLQLDKNGNINQETAWSGSGGGLSKYESKPAYQSALVSGDKRSTPDVAYNADPNTGYAVYTGSAYYGKSGWFEVGGTSAGAPQWAALIALANQNQQQNHVSTLGKDNPFYSSYSSKTFHDITSGSNGSCRAFCAAHTGFDQVTGLGSPLVKQFVQKL